MRTTWNLFYTQTGIGMEKIGSLNKLLRIYPLKLNYHFGVRLFLHKRE